MATYQAQAGTNNQNVPAICISENKANATEKYTFSHRTLYYQKLKGILILTPTEVWWRRKHEKQIALHHHKRKQTGTQQLHVHKPL